MKVSSLKVDIDAQFEAMPYLREGNIIARR